MDEGAPRAGQRHGGPVLAGIAAVLLVGIAVAAWRWDRGDDAPTARVSRGRLEVTIETAGTLVPASERTIAAPVAGTVLRMGVEPGDRIAAGDIVALLDPRPFADRLDAAHRALEAAEFAALIAPAPPAGTPAAVGEALAAAVRVAEARAAVTEAQRDRDAATILAPEPGTVLEVPAAPGNALLPGAPVARLAAASPLVVRADLDEIDLPRVSVGTPVRVLVDAYPGEPLGGTIADIAPEGVAQGGGVVFPIRIAFTDPGALAETGDLRPGMTVAVAVPAVVAEDALLVPERAVVTVGRRSFVTVERNGSAVEVEVRPGLRAAGQVEILNGPVEVGERVRVNG